MKIKTDALAARLARARSAIGRGINYRLGHGGFDPHAVVPSNDGLCDCSGFVAWTLPAKRSPKPGRGFWIESTAVHRDASGRQSVFVRIPEPIPGCIAVYPDSGGRQGHIAIVADPKKQTVVDCSVSGKGIAEHPQRVFWRRSDTVWCVLRQDVEGGA